MKTYATFLAWELHPEGAKDVTARRDYQYFGLSWQVPDYDRKRPREIIVLEGWRFPANAYQITQESENPLYKEPLMLECSALVSDDPKAYEQFPID